MPKTKTEPRVKISKLEIGATIQIDGEKEYISETDGACISTLARAGKGNENIIETAYLITKDGFQDDGQRFLSSYASRIIRKEERDFELLNKKLTRYETLRGKK